MNRTALDDYYLLFETGQVVDWAQWIQSRLHQPPGRGFAEIAASEVAIKLATKPAGSIRSEGWIRRALHSEIVNLIRADSRAPRQVEVEATSRPLSPTADPETLACLAKGLVPFSEDEMIAVAQYVQYSSLTDYCEANDCPYHATRRRAIRGTDSLIKRVTKLGRELYGAEEWRLILDDLSDAIMLRLLETSSAICPQAQDKLEESEPINQGD